MKQHFDFSFSVIQSDTFEEILIYYLWYLVPPLNTQCQLNCEVRSEKQNVLTLRSLPNN